MAGGRDTSRDTLRKGVDERKQKAYLDRVKIMFHEDPRLILNDPAQFGMKTAEEIQASKNYPDEKGEDDLGYRTPSMYGNIAQFLQAYFESSFGLSEDQARKEAALSLFYLTNYLGINVETSLGNGLIAIDNGTLNIWKEKDDGGYVLRLSNIELRPPAGMITPGEEGSRSGASGGPGQNGKPRYAFPAAYAKKPGREKAGTPDEAPAEKKTSEEVPPELEAYRPKRKKGESPQASARRHRNKAKEHYDAGEYDEAIAEFEKAYRAFSNPAVLFDIGKTHEKNGDEEQALQYYRRYLEDAPENDEHINEAKERVLKIEEDLRKREEAAQTVLTPDAAPASEAKTRVAAIPEALRKEFEEISNLLFLAKQKLLGTPAAGASTIYQGKTKDNIAFEVWPGSFASEIETFWKIFHETYQLKNEKDTDEYQRQLRVFWDELNRLNQKTTEITRPLSKAFGRLNQMPEQQHTLSPWINLSYEHRGITLIYYHHKDVLNSISAILVKELKPTTPPPAPPPAPAGDTASAPKEKLKVPELSDDEKIALAKRRYEDLRIALWGSLMVRYRDGRRIPEPLSLFAQLDSILDSIDQENRSVKLEDLEDFERQLNNSSAELEAIDDLVKSAGWFQWVFGTHDIPYYTLQRDIGRYKNYVETAKKKLQRLLGGTGGEERMEPPPERDIIPPQSAPEEASAPSLPSPALAELLQNAEQESTLREIKFREIPPDAYFSDEPPEEENQIQPADEKDILGFLSRRGYFDYCKDACKQFGVPLHILLSIMRCESRFNHLARTHKNPVTNQYSSSARGLGQFLDGDWYGVSEAEWKTGKRNKDRGFVNAPPAENPWGENADRLNPQHAIWAAARHIRNKISDANTTVRANDLPPRFLLDLNSRNPEMVKWIYMAFMSGGQGYCALRQHLEDPQNNAKYAALFPFQKEPAIVRVANGKILKKSYIDRAKGASYGGMRFASYYLAQIRRNAPDLEKIHLPPNKNT